MVNEVNKIIRNTLITQGAVTLPGIGTLTITRQSATRRSKREVTAPRYAIEFSSKENGTSLIETIVEVANISMQSAEDIYARWHDKVRADNKIIINSVGTLSHKTFVADREFISALNPDADRVIKVKAKSMVALYVISTIVIAICGGIAALLLLAPANKQQITPYYAEAEVGESSVIEDVSHEITDEIDSVIYVTQTQEVILTENADNNEIEEITKTDDSSSSWTDNDNLRHWVVAGTYSTSENADRAIAKINRENPDIDCLQFKLGKMYAVAIYGSTDLDECEKFMMMEKKRFNAMWIHTPKRFR